MFTKTFFSAIAASVLFVASASAICPGYKFGIAQSGGQMNGNNGVWQVYDNSCNVVHQETGQKPCNGGVFDCNSAQTTFTGLHLNNVNYACSPDTNADSCNGQAIQVCCH
ncbi:hypothetical protein BKA82DRAFT_4353110 [Pisolithus tinctorius]|uniref:Cyanovirin-N domain-containing protein n=1 Tax=Pisolithus tinctorius Marx 270 TaxID=870435 RepID=A0A0C3NY77_PISTI|nr:hypothetical protein BKA82DRAFT_4353110 [Pisolithus tinctorius]KIO00109.1 hypothetical protein M404DRAFT_29731 [Pisolithus tinctorius Marx 270]